MWDGRYGVESLVASSFFKRLTIFDENFVAVESHKGEVLLNQPLYIAAACLDISNYLMGNFFYNYLKHEFKDKGSLIYGDIDSKILFVEGMDFYKDSIRKYSQFYDTSNYSADNTFVIVPQNKRVLGKFKDELAGKILRKVCWCISYAKLMEDNEDSFDEKASADVKRTLLNRMMM